MTSGKHLDPLAALVAKLFIDSGVPRSAVHFGSKVELPGFFRPQKKWDIVVVHESRLVAAIELKSILGSYGNNLNNRAEEAIGNAHDLRRAFRDERLAKSGPPWLAYLFVMQREPASTRPVALRSPHFLPDAEFESASYIDRATLLLERLVQDGLYDTACMATSDGTDPKAVQEPSKQLSFTKFVQAIQRRASGA